MRVDIVISYTVGAILGWFVPDWFFRRMKKRRGKQFIQEDSNGPCEGGKRSNDLENLKKREKEIRKRLPCNPGGFRDLLFNGIEGYLNVRCFRRNLGRYAIRPVMELYPEAYERLVDAVAREVEVLKAEGIPPFGKAGEK